MEKKKSFPVTFGRKLLVLFALAALLFSATPSLSDELRLISFNITGAGDQIELPQTRIVQGLQPDIALLQEWHQSSSGPWGTNYRAWVDEAFGEDFYYYRGLGGITPPPNGIVSRWPIKSSESWKDVEMYDSYFDAAIIDIPGDIDLQVVSIHLKADPGGDATRIAEATNLRALVQANFDENQYIVVSGDLNTTSWSDETDLMAIFDSFLQVEEESCQPENERPTYNTNVNYDKKFDWIIPNEVVGDASPLFLGISEYQYPCGNVFDSRVFPSVVTELPPIQYGDTDSGDMDHCPIMKSFNILPAGGGFFVMKADQDYDYNLYLYSSLESGDITYWDAAARNPSPIARDLWMIPSGNNTIAMTHLAMNDDEGRGLSALALMKNEGGDHNLYIYNSILPGDWTYWDAIARNPSPIARDLWIVPEGNNTSLMTRTENSTDGIDELVIMKNTWGGQKFYIYNAPRFGDWTYTDAFLRNWNGSNLQFYLAFDEWMIPRYSNVSAMAGMRVVNSVDSSAERIVTIENSWGDQNLFVWKVPYAGCTTFLQNHGFQIGPNPSIPDPFPRNMRQGFPQGQDLWIVTQRNDIQAIMGIGADAVSGDSADTYDVIGGLGNKGGDDNLWIWKSVQRGDTTYEQALLRQDGYPRARADIPNYGQPQARDFWVIPEGNNVRQIAAIPSTAPPPTPTPTDWIKADFDWDPEEPEENETATFTDKSTTGNPPIVSWYWEFQGGSPSSRATQGPHDVTWSSKGNYTVSLEVVDFSGQTDFNSKHITIIEP